MFFVVSVSLLYAPEGQIYMPSKGRFICFYLDCAPEGQLLLAQSSTMEVCVPLLCAPEGQLLLTQDDTMGIYAPLLCAPKGQLHTAQGNALGKYVPTHISAL